MEAQALRAEGLKYREIAERMGISLSYAAELATDPDGSKVRERKMQGRCEDCGTAIYSDAVSTPQRRCSKCQHTAERANAEWKPDAVLDAIKRWARLYGKPPAANAWNTAQAHPEDLKRFRAGRYPHYSDVCRKFGRWSDAIRAAGLKPRHKNAGKPRNSVSEAEYRAMEQMRADGKTVVEIAGHFGITPNTAHMRFQRRKGNMGASLKAETVLEREIARFEDRRDRAEEEAKEAAEQASRLKAALSALKNGSSPHA